MDRKRIKKAVDSAQRAQRNYDLSKQIPSDDLDTLIYAAKNSPSKQNETHYSLHVFTDPNTIRKIYNNTKRFGLHRDNDINKFYKEVDGKFLQNENLSVTNSQVLSNVLFAYVDADGVARGGAHKLAKQNKNSVCKLELEEQKNYSIGISVGELILTAGLLGYKTGICSAFSHPIENIISIEDRVKILVGIGISDNNKNRRHHAELLNSDLPLDLRTGNENDSWKFPSFEKECKVFLNGKDYS